ncbi:MAG: hypothetical protein AABM64_01565 [Pseudomonadota bacterium]
MSSYKAEDPIRACHVDRDLIAALEQWFATQLPRVIPTAVTGDKSATFKLTIEDALGKETLASVNEIGYAGLLDSTSGISLDWRSPYGAKLGLDIALKFDPSIFRVSRLTIEAQGEQARESVIVVKESVGGIIAKHRTLSGFFHPFIGAEPLAWLLTGMALTATVTAALSNRNIAGVGGLITVGLLWYAATGTFVKPFVSFDTRAYRTRMAVWRWFSLGLAGFIIFGTALPETRRMLFGF